MDSLNLLNTRIEYAKNDLIERLDSLAKTLEIESTKLKNDTDYKPNSLGIIQRSSDYIDLLCANIWSLNEAKELIEAEKN